MIDNSTFVNNVTYIYSYNSVCVSNLHAKEKFPKWVSIKFGSVHGKIRLFRMI